MKPCPYCAGELADDATSCVHCGRQLSLAAAPPVQAARRTGTNRTLKIVLIAGGVLAGVCVLAVLVVGAMSVIVPCLPSIGPRAQVILAPDVALVSSVTQADLQADARLLSERQRKGCGMYDTSFRVTADNRIIGEGPASSFTEERLLQMIKPGLLELVDFEDAPPAEGTTIATDLAYPQAPLPGSRQWHTVMTNADFDSVSVQKSEAGTPQIAFTLTPAGKQTLADFTTNNIGHYLGIVLDKRVISAPIIRSAITDGQGVIEGGFTEETAQALAGYLRARMPLLVPLKIVDFIAPTAAP